MKHSMACNTRWLLSSSALGLRAAPFLIGTVLASASQALPVGGVVSGGDASIGSAGTHTVVFQGSDRAVIDWQSFDVGAGETVHFSQPSANAAILNRIHDTDASRIDGALSANGQVFLVNPNGMVFGRGAQVDVGSLVASTADISNAAFMKGGVLDFNLAGRPDASITNAGSITVAQGGLAALVAPQVVNAGSITAQAGTVALAAGDRFTLDMYGDDLLHVSVSDAVKRQSVTHSGSIYAQAGTVLLTTAEAASVIDSVINTSGLTDASSATEEGGTIVFAGQDADIRVSAGAILDASGALGGGTVRVGGEYMGGGDTPTARTTAIEKGTSIKVNATQTGNGGEVIVWSDKTTIFAGHIEAKGGANPSLTPNPQSLTPSTKGSAGEASITEAVGGAGATGKRPSEPSAREAASHASDSTSRSGDKTNNGGFVETSGKEKLYATGTVDASAPHGKAGQWLLDPTNVTISNGAGTDVTTCSASPHTCNGVATIDANTIQTALNGGTSVTVTTTSGGGDLGDISMNGVTITKSAGGDATLRLQANRNISIVNSTISSTLGALGFILQADQLNGNTAGSIDIQNTTITTNGGDFVAGGGLNPYTDEAWGNGGNVVGVTLNNGDITTGAGAIHIRGKGENSAGNFRYGTIIYNGSVLSTTTGAINITGTGGNGTTSNLGIYLHDAGTLITSVDGNISLTGQGGSNGAAGSNSNYGVQITGGADIISTGTGANAANISISGTGGAGEDGNVGIFSGAAGTTITAIDGDISLTGQGGTNGTAASSDSYGIFLQSGPGITSTGTGASAGNITLTGTGGTADGGYSYGIFMQMAGASVSAVDGDITLTGQGGNSAAAGSNSNHGILIDNTAQVTSTGTGTSAGTITLNGTGGNGDVSNYGIWMENNSLISSAYGAMLLTGQGGSNGAAGSNSNYGIHLSNGADIISTGTGANAANISISGTGGAGEDGNRGVYITGAGTTVSAVRGNISITGQGGTNGLAGSSVNQGVAVENNAVVSTSGGAGQAGNITIVGTGSSGEDANHGILIHSAGSITTDKGGITLTGTGGSNGTVASDTNVGVFINSGTISSTGSGASIGTITLTGTGASAGNVNNYGVHLTTAAAQISTVDANVSVTGTGGVGATNLGIYLLTDSDISSTGTGNITLTGTTGAGGTDIFTAGGTIDIGGATSTGNVTFIANDLNISATTTITTLGNIQFSPRSDATPIGVAGGAGTLNIGTALLGQISAGNELIIGSATADGAMSVTPYALWSSRAGTGVKFLSDDGAITLAAGAHGFGARNLTIETDADPTITGTVTGTGILTLMPSSAAQTMGVASGAGVMNVSAGDLANLGTGWASLNLGRPDGLGTLTQGAYSWFSPTTWRAATAGSVAVTGAQSADAASDARFTFSAPLSLSADLDTSAATGGTRAIAMNNATTLGANTTINAGAGNVTFASTLNGAHTLGVTTTGDVTFTGAAGDVAPLGALTVTGADDVSAASGMTATGAIDITAASTITGIYKGTTGNLNAGAGAITAATSFNNLNIVGSGATLSAGYIGASGDPINQNMANKISISGVVYPALIANAAYTFAGYVIGAANSLGVPPAPAGGGAPVTPPTPLPPAPLPPVEDGDVVVPLPVSPPVLPPAPNDSGVSVSPGTADIREATGSNGLPTVYTHPSSYLKNFVLISDIASLVTLDTTVDNVDVQHQEHKDDRDSELVDSRDIIIDAHLRAWLNGH